jgi:hypothetical protein
MGAYAIHSWMAATTNKLPLSELAVMNHSQRSASGRYALFTDSLISGLIWLFLTDMLEQRSLAQVLCEGKQQGSERHGVGKYLS